MTHLEGAPCPFNTEGTAGIPRCRCAHDGRLLDSDLARLRLVDVSPGRVEELLQAKVTLVKPQTVNHIRSCLGRAFAAAIRADRYWGENPVSRVRKRKVPKRPPQYVKAEEVPHLLPAVPARWRAVFATALYRGLP